jgi:hypothetical protein
MLPLHRRLRVLLPPRSHLHPTFRAGCIPTRRSTANLYRLRQYSDGKPSQDDRSHPRDRENLQRQSHRFSRMEQARDRENRPKCTVPRKLSSWQVAAFLTYSLRCINAHKEWLFKHVAAVIHHGGAGTTACGLLNGRPTAIVPFLESKLCPV